MGKDIQKITLFGSGNVATHLGQALLDSGLEIVQVWSRNLDNAKILANKLNSKAINKTSQLRDSDLFLVAISDDAIVKFIRKLPGNTPVAHTSGNTALTSRMGDAPSGVFYPLQTFSKSSIPNWKTIPICIESNEQAFLKLLFNLGEQLTDTVKIINSEQRSIIHTSAVIACNFTNHLGALAEDILTTHNLSIELLKPLIEQTFKNISAGNVKSKQTGPAVREDYGTMESHLKNLDGNEDIKSLYLTLSKHIIKYHHG